MSAKPQTLNETAPQTAKRALRALKWDVGTPKVVDGKPQAEYGFALKMPKGAQIFRVGRQLQIARIWALANLAFREEERYFWVANTNSDLPGSEDLEAEFARVDRGVKVIGLEPLGTWLEANEKVEKHLFEIVTEPAARTAREPGED
jgi:hypothetical protein